MTITKDYFNIKLATSPKEVDEINKKFYGRYNYPWPPMNFQAYPKGISISFLNQDVGCWNHTRIPKIPRIWVAGCGTNQALNTALRYPEADVLGTDISTQSIEQCKKNAIEIGVQNLQLEEISINEIDYNEEFDFIICTGVVHHNSDPKTTLDKLSRALKRNGIMEFMIYNYYHRILNTACQKVVRGFSENEVDFNMERELQTMNQLISGFDKNNLMGNFVYSFKDSPEAMMADALLQPVEHSYTIEGMEKMLNSCNLESLLHCMNQFDGSKDRITWNLTFDHPVLNTKYYSLSDCKRWQITNLLMLQESPMLWFYLQRKDATWVRHSEKEVCDKFLTTSFRKNTFDVENYKMNLNGSYKLDEEALNYPLPSRPNHKMARSVWDEITPDKKMKDILAGLGIEPHFHQVNELRVRLTTLQFPYLIANR